MTESKAVTRISDPILMAAIHSLVCRRIGVVALTSAPRNLKRSAPERGGWATPRRRGARLQASSPRGRRP
ncbi:MAG TPA: hypothetical protein VNN80_33860 [Polyangiaceae bacterium]|nr:hypothetical protein [Polyangiaceae bacterium]